MPIIETSGARLSYARVGDGPAVLFVQGVGIVGEGWRPQVDALKSDFTCISFLRSECIAITAIRAPVNVV